GDLKETLADELKGLVTIRHTDRPIQSILLPEEVVAIRQVLLLKLEMARSALLRGDDALYKENMDSALAWLKENFDPAAALTQSLAEDIQNLRGLQLQPPLPDISKSLALLRNIEKLRVEPEKGSANKSDKAGRAEKIPAPSANEQALPPPAPAQPPAQPVPVNPPSGQIMGPVMEPQPEEGAKP
ncbi:MAG: uroporphyrinogen-III C-methyltransferase, partial [Candidatus Methylumidiphilus sp.]